MKDDSPYADRDVCFNKLHNLDKRQFDNVIQSLALCQGDYILDCGAGSGEFCAEILLRNRCVRLDLFDESTSQLLRAREAIGDVSNVRFICGKVGVDVGGGFAVEYNNSEELRLRPQYDVILLKMTLHDIPKDEQATIVKGLFSKLKKGGRFLIWEPFMNGSTVEFIREAISNKDLLAGFLKLNKRRYFPSVNELAGYTQFEQTECSVVPLPVYRYKTEAAERIQEIGGLKKAKVHTKYLQRLVDKLDGKRQEELHIKKSGCNGVEFDIPMGVLILRRNEQWNELLNPYVDKFDLGESWTKHFDAIIKWNYRSLSSLFKDIVLLRINAYISHIGSNADKTVQGLDYVSNDSLQCVDPYVGYLNQAYKMQKKSRLGIAGFLSSFFRDSKHIAWLLVSRRRACEIRIELGNYRGENKIIDLRYRKNDGNGCKPRENLNVAVERYGAFDGFSRLYSWSHDKKTELPIDFFASNIETDISEEMVEFLEEDVSAFLSMAAFDMRVNLIRDIFPYLRILVVFMERSGVCSTCYIIPAATFLASGKSVRKGVVMCCTKQHVMLSSERSRIEPYLSFARYIWDATETALRLLDAVMLKTAQTKSAIGSIMSRNGSHNIGSHVLAALSHNVGTMPDDRVLYQYIQQRMDYIANVTTEAPSWSQPTMFLGDIMRTFLSQRHLLSHIAESEGLGAWEFQNKNMDDLMARGQHDKLRFQIRRHFKNEKNCGVNYTSVIRYENNGATIDFQDDIALAIPGGIAGQHAFFTIIENIVRNAAKHDWSNPPKKTEAFKKKDNGQDDDDRYGNLNIYIDYEDKELDGCVEFTIWTNMSDVLEHVDDGKGLDSAKAIHNILNKKLDAQFIDETTGRLRRENWGLAEMRISAGYLQGNNISEIGGIDKPAKPIIQATVHNEDDINHLAYRFCVPKPKRMLILVDDDRSNRTKCEKARLQEVLKKYRNQASECKKFGLYVKTYTEVKAECSDKKKPKLNYEYVVMDDMREEQASWYLPFRVLSIKQTEVAGAKDLVPTIGGYASCLDIIEDVTESKGRKSSIESNIKLVEEAIYSSWCSYIKSLQIEKNTALNLILSVKDDSSGNEGRGLVSKRDVVKFVFEESFNSAVRSYIKLNKLSEVSEAYVALNALKEKRRGLVELDTMEGNDYKGLIMRCFQSFCTPTNSVAREESRITKEIAKVKSDKKIKENFRTKRLAELRKELDEARNKTQEEVGRGIGAYGGFLDYLEKVCEQMETILCKYAENIVTLPSGFRSDGVGVVEEYGKVWDAAAVGWWKGPRPSDDALGSVGLDIKAPTIEFIRHYHPEDKDDQPGNRLYAEPLSGSQSYLNMLEKCSFADKATIVKLVETALLRVLVIDERVAKFLREHKDEVSQTYKSMRIYVADDKKVDEELQMLQSKSDKAGIRKLKAFRWCKPQLDSLLVSLSSYNIYEGRKVLQAEAARPVDRKLQNKFTKDGKKQFDVLIVHQGIIDKWFPATANSPETVENLLCYLRQIFPYVIITTGRGSPANIPETARMLPFSTVEATLFRKYPEKLLLMDSVMNILPKGESSYE